MARAGLPIPPQSRLWATFKALLRARITQGIIVVLPIWLTIVIVRFVFELARDASVWALNAIVPHETLVAHIKSFVVSLPQNWRIWLGGDDLRIAEDLEGWGLAIFAVFLTIFILYVVGLFAANIVGRRVILNMERLLERVPLVKTVYRSSKQILTTFSSEQSQTMQRVALVPLSGERVYTIGFITNVFRDPTTNDELCTVFISSVPSPTTSYVVVVRRKEVIELNWSFEDALKMVISGGILLPGPFSIVPPPAGAADESRGPALPTTGQAGRAP